MKLNEADVTQRLRALPGWELSGDAITQQFVFPDFGGAMAYAVRLALAAETADHHPDILISYKRVTVTFSTHSAGGLTGKDFAGAEEATRLAGVSGAR